MDWPYLLEPSFIGVAALKIVLSGTLGGLVGFEREAHGQAAGFRTYILVSMACCLIMMISLHMEEIYRYAGSESAVRVDPGRIASYALAGMGFLGAGAIIVGKGSVRGLTTAAGMWMITAVGLAVGCGYFVPAAMVTLLSLFSLYVLRYTKRLFHRDVYKSLTLISDDVGGQLKRIEATIAKYSFSKIQFVEFDRRLNQKAISFRISLVSKEDLEWRELTKDLSELPGIRRIVWEEGRVP